MAAIEAGVILRHIREALAAQPASRLPDRQLLERFTASHEEAAFAALVRRHGPLVLSLCRRLLGNWHDAEDVFQATFLALARKASTIGKGDSVASWLYRVAYRAAVKARAQGASRKRREAHASCRPAGDPLAEVTARDLLAVLDEEIQRLPESSRGPLILCYLEGQTRDEAARQLGWSVGTLKRRLERARESLRARLAWRGLTLPAALLAAGLTQSAADAAVPAVLTVATVRASLQTAAGAGGVSPTVAALAEAAVESVGAAKIKVGTVSFLTVSLLALTVGGFVYQASGQRLSATAATNPSQAARKEAPPTSKPAAAVGSARPAPDSAARLTINGQVLGHDGKALAQAQVAALAQTPYPYQGKELHFQTFAARNHHPDSLLGRVRTDAAGRFRLTIPRSLVTARVGTAAPVLTIVGIAPGHAVGWLGVPLAEAQARAEAVLRLAPEEPIRGRLFDLQGAPAAGVKLYLVKAAAEAAGKYTGIRLLQEEKDAPFWPGPATTDADGRFVLHGVRRDMDLLARVHDDRFALHDLVMAPGQKEEVRLGLAPARVIEGRVLTEDTRLPVADVEVSVVAYPKGPSHNMFLAVRTDKEGRYRVNHYEAPRYDVRTGDLEGKPYFAINFIHFDWPKGGTIKHTMDITLPRGVVQRGKVVDAAGRPVAGARLLYLPQLNNNPFIKGDPLELWTRQIGRAETHADGTFQIVALPGPGHLAVYARGEKEYVQHGRSRREIFAHERLGGFWIATEFVKLDVQPGADPAAVTATLRPAVRLRGQVVSQDGKPVPQARLALVPVVADAHRQGRVGVVEVKDGRFEAKGCEAGTTYAALVVDAQGKRAALASLTGKEGDAGTLKVRLEDAGTITARLVDAKGQPAKRQYPLLVWIKSAGRKMARMPDAFEEVAVTDAAGRISLTNLVPGVTYTLSEPDGREVREVTIEPGMRRDLGDVVIDPKK
jgi:RNA polymerase sigma factor (sigma-70 family)